MLAINSISAVNNYSVEPLSIPVKLMMDALMPLDLRQQSPEYMATRSLLYEKDHCWVQFPHKPDSYNQKYNHFTVG